MASAVAPTPAAAPEKPPPPATTVVRPFTSFNARGINPPNFAAWRPRDQRNQPAKEIGWSCDGKYLAACGNDKTVKVWQPERTIDMRGATSLAGAHSYSVDCISWHPSHPELLCSASKRDTKFAYWDTRQPKPIQTLSLSRRPISIQFSPEGQNVMLVDDDDKLSFLKFGEPLTSDGKKTWAASSSPAFSPAWSATWAHSGTAAFVGDASGSIRVVEVASMEVLDRLTLHLGPCYALALDPRGKYLASGGADSIINLIGLDQWMPVRSVSCFDGTVSALSFSHDGEYIAVAGDINSFVDIIASETGEALHRIPTSPAPQSVAWHPSKYVLAYSGETSGPGTTGKGTISVFGSA